jgi:hypothetical protein
MLAKPVIEEFTNLCDNMGYDLIRGSFAAITGEDIDGQVELIVAPGGKYLIFFWDIENNKLTGVFNEGFGDKRLNIGSEVDEESKVAVINRIACSIQGEDGLTS